jgi:hypothetical protein
MGCVGSNLFGCCGSILVSLPVVQQTLRYILEKLVPLEMSSTASLQFIHRYVPGNKGIQHHTIEDRKIHLLVPFLKMDLGDRSGNVRNCN